MNLLLQDTITAEEFLRWPGEKGCELIDGKVVEKQKGAKAAYIGGVLLYHIQTFLDANRRGWVFPSAVPYQMLPARPNLVRKPDVSFIRLGRLPNERPPAGQIRFAPDLAVDVVSPNELYYDVEQKVADYRAAGVRLIWIVSPPTRSVLIRRLDGGCAEAGETGELSGEDVLPGFRCPVSGLFQDLRPAPESPPASA